MSKFTRRSAARPLRSHRARLWLHRLEDRVTPTNFIVMNTADTGGGSLRDAIAQANAMMGADTITFAAGVTGTITLTTGELLISDDVTITGPGTASITVSGNNANRVFDISNAAAVLNVTLSRMTVSGGHTATGTLPVPDGGGIFADDENVTLETMVVTGNQVVGGTGDSGGGVAAAGNGSLTIRNSTISGNTCTGRGGGIYFFDSGSLLLENSTVSGNTNSTSTNGGGGIYFYGTVGAAGVTIRNSTISGNTSSLGNGGGIALLALNGTALIQNSTITNNSSGRNSTADGTGGGGIALVSGTAASIVTLQSTIVSGNTANPVNGRSDLSILAAGTLNAYNCAIGVNAGFTLSPASMNNLPFGAVLNLGPLTNNGGPTFTHAVPAGSPAENAGSNPASLTTDQRGPGFPRIQGSAPDIGAFERAVNAPSASGTFANITTTGVTTYTFQVTYSDASAINVSSVINNSSAIRVTGPGGFNQLATYVSINNSTNGTPRTATYSITGPGGAFTPAANGAYSVAVQANQVFNTGGVAVPAATIGTFQVLVPQTFTVTNLNDAGAGSLRDVLAQANAQPGTVDTIVFQASLAGTISLTTGELLISDSVTIIGPGAGVLTVRRDPGAATQFRVFDVNGSGVINVAISGLTISGGNTTGTPGAGTSGDGAGLLLFNENLTLSNVVVSGNTTATEGGGIGVASGGGFLTVRNSTISGNVANGIGTAAGGGGGIYFANGGSLLVENSTISGNTSTNFEGGGLYFYGNVGAGGLTVRNSTIAGNTAGVNGGGIGLRTVTGTLSIQNSTITANTAGTTTGTGGGGIAQVTGTAAIITIINSIVSGNTNSVAPDIASTGTVNVNFSAVGSATGFTPSGSSGNNLPFGANLLLGVLANNGGPTQTIAFQFASPLRNAGTNPIPALTGDQRGAAGFARNFGGAVDIGAFEFQAQAAAIVNDGSVQRSRVTSLTVTFTGVASFSGTVAGAFTLTRVSDGAVVTFSAAANTVNGVTVVTINNFTGSATNFGSLADGRYTLTANATQITIGGSQLDGDGNGTPGGNFVFGDAQGLYRFFGDINGDRHVDIADFGVFSASIFSPANYVAAFDFNNDGVIDIADFGQFSIRIFTMLP
jgi:parallel beta-helix repeat protein